MIVRLLPLFVLIVALGACSSLQKDESDVSVGPREDITQGPLYGTESYDGYDSEALAVESGAVPGTQQDLVVNIGDRVFFGYDRYDLTAEAQDSLQRQAEWLIRYPGVTVTIEGHCDERGTREYNLALGERRANAVKNYLIALGIPAHRLGVISYGKERPAALGAGEDVWAQNRRGVTRVD